VQEAVTIARSLLDIFSYAGNVNALLTALCAMDFDDDALQITGVLRSNSHLTNILKVFAMRFGDDYFCGVTLKIIDYIVQAGDIGLRTGDGCDPARVQQMIMSAITTVMRTVGSVLKAFAEVRFNRRKAVYNTLSGLFYLRFLTGAIMDVTLFQR
jgi:hypothetical protein